MQKLMFGKLLITLVALFTAISPYLADWNETHIYNPLWTPHAKFHNAQTMMFGALCGLFALYFLWFRSNGSDNGERLTNVKVATVFAMFYWAAQAGAFMFPGVASFDSQFAATAPSRIFGLPGQLGMDIIIACVLGVAYYLEYRRLNNQKLAQSETFAAQAQMQPR